MSGYTKLYNSILTSSVWCGQDAEAKVVWITLLASADRNGVVDVTLPGLAKLAEVPVEKTKQVLDHLCALDPLDSVNSPLNGVKRRLDPLDRGWVLRNYKKYRDHRQYEERKEYMRKYMRDYMQKKRGTEKSNAVRPGNKQCLAQAEALPKEYVDKKVNKGGSGGDFDISIKQENQNPEPANQPTKCVMPGCKNLTANGNPFCSDACRDYAEYLTTRSAKGNPS